MPNKFYICTKCGAQMNELDRECPNCNSKNPYFNEELERENEEAANRAEFSELVKKDETIIKLFVVRRSLRANFGFIPCFVIGGIVLLIALSAFLPLALKGKIGDIVGLIVALAIAVVLLIIAIVICVKNKNNKIQRDIVDEKIEERMDELKKQVEGDL